MCMEIHSNGALLSEAQLFFLRLDSHLRSKLSPKALPPLFPALPILFIQPPLRRETNDVMGKLRKFLPLKWYKFTLKSNQDEMDIKDITQCLGIRLGVGEQSARIQVLRYCYDNRQLTLSFCCLSTPSPAHPHPRVSALKRKELASKEANSFLSEQSPSSTGEATLSYQCFSLKKWHEKYIHVKVRYSHVIPIICPLILYDPGGQL